MVKFQTPSCNTFCDMNYCSVILVKSRQTGRRTESDEYEPTVQYAQVGSIKFILNHGRPRSNATKF